MKTDTSAGHYQNDPNLLSQGNQILFETATQRRSSKICSTAVGLTRLEVSNRQVLEASSKESLSHSIRSTVSLRVSTDSLTTRHLPSKTSSDTLSSKDITRNHLQLYKTKTKLGKIFKKCDRKILSSSSSEP